MNFLRFFTKYSTRILLVSVLASLVLFSVLSFSKAYDKKTESLKDIVRVSDIKVQIKSFVSKAGENVSFTGKITNAKNNKLVDANVSVTLKNSKNPKLFTGDTVVLSGKWFGPKGKMNIGGFDDAEYSKSENIHGRIYSDEKIKIASKGKNKFIKGIYSLRNRFIEKTDKFLKPRYAGIAKALVTGDRSSVLPEDSAAFKESGVYHIVAISGLHLNIFIILFTYFISSLKLKRLKKALLSALVCTAVGGFVLVFTGFGLSVIRAFAMLVISLGSAVFARKYSSKNALFLGTAFIMILLPYSFYSVGFRLSVLSTYGVLLSGDIINRLQKSKRLSKIASSGVTATAVTSLVCAMVTLPVTADSFGYLPVYSFVANILILPLMAPALGGCVFFGIAAISGLDFLAELVMYPLTGILHIVLSFAKITSMLPMATINLYPKYTLYVASILAAAVLCIYLLHKNSRVTAILTALFFTVAGCLVFVYNDNSTEAKVVFAYSEQGDCSIITLPGKESIMVDFGTGPGTEYIIDEIKMSLVKYNISKLDAVFVSHFHQDHVSGITELVEDGYVRNVFIPRFYDKNDEESADNRQKLLEAALKTNTAVHQVKDGSSVTTKSGARFDVLSPKSDMFMDANNMSAVIKFTYGDVSFLFTGDVSKDGIPHLYDKDISCDVLKVPHHGSKNSNDRYFIKKSNPDYALISCGENNFYDHPDKEVLDTLESENIQIYRTDRDGAVTFCFDKKEIKSIETMR